MLRLRDFMSTQVLTVPVEADAEAAWDQMRVNRIHHLVVIDRNQPVGIISDGDLGGPRVALRLGKKVGELMTSQIVSLSPRATVREAARLMRGRAIGCLPVFDDGKLVGIVTISDLLDLLGKGILRDVAKEEAASPSDKVPHKRAILR